ncbi:MAG TPA: mannitol-1-phosphate 5-dehydrogenase [Clostridiaceae bacterium]|jgi:mannitol-1-phosphate 5-dehydrogenase|nr:mannitol-1-phosphate 5-dehydrogenase [Clostridiaceae bacterium]
MKKAVMYGAGNIGRGFIGQLFSQSGYEVVFIDVNPVIIERINVDRSYPIRIVEDEKSKEIIIRDVRAVNGMDIEATASEIANADIMATAVGVNVLPKIVKPIVSGLKKRWQIGNTSPLNIIICENLLDANQYLEQLLKQELEEDEKKLFDKKIGLVEASIGRMVPIMTEEMQEGNPLRVYVEKYCELPVDKNAFKGEIPKIQNMIPFSPFDLYIQRKLFMHNMGHATAAYLGFYKDYEYIWETCKDSSIKLITFKALLESSIALSIEHNYPLKELIEHANDLIYRFGNKLLGDTVARVGRDPVRKLSKNDRLIGAAKLCIKNGINPVYISIGIAAGYAFSSENDTSAEEISKTINEFGINKAMEKYSNVRNDWPLFNQVIEFYEMLKAGKPLEYIEKEAEKIKINHKYID